MLLLPREVTEFALKNVYYGYHNIATTEVSLGKTDTHCSTITFVQLFKQGSKSLLMLAEYKNTEYMQGSEQ